MSTPKTVGHSLPPPIPSRPGEEVDKLRGRGRRLLARGTVFNNAVLHVHSISRDCTTNTKDIAGDRIAVARNDAAEFSLFEEVLLANEQRVVARPRPMQCKARAASQPCYGAVPKSEVGGGGGDARQFEGNRSGRYILGCTFSFVFRDSAIFRDAGASEAAQFTWDLSHK